MGKIIKKGDFVEIEYDGKLKEEGIIFDTTSKETAKKQGIHNPNVAYGKVIICVGENQILAGVDKAVEGRETEKEYDINISPEDGFGKKRTDLLKMVPASVFRRENIEPVPGLQVNIDGMLGTVRTVSGGRIIVDFNHPLASRELSYHLKIGKKIIDKEEQLKSYLSLALNLRKDVIEAAVEGEKAVVTLKMELPEEAKKHLNERISKVAGIKNIEFRVKKAGTKKE